MTDWSRRRSTRLLVAVVTALLSSSGVALAHGGALAAESEPIAVPPWLFLLTGGAAVGASFLLASFVTDRAFVRRVDTWHRVRSVARFPLARLLGEVVGVVGLLLILAFGFLGPAGPTYGPRNPAVLVVWVGWWAGYVMSTYLVGNTWPTLNPVRTVARRLPSLSLSYPDRLGAWPSVVGLLGLVWLEVVSPLSADPRLLATVVTAYLVVSLAGTVLVGEAVWFGRVDPIARVFHYYGRVAPLVRDGSGLRLRLPGMGLTEQGGVDGRSEVAFVVAIVWVTTFDGLVVTPTFADAARRVVDAGLPTWAVYPLALAGGFALFLGLYHAAAHLARRTGDTYLTADALARRFAPSLLAIAAGYHLAHFLGYLVSLSPSLVEALATPFTPLATSTVIVLPGWFVGVNLAFVLVGHLLAIWVAHAAAFDTFPSRLQAVRSQYPFVAVMVVYTMVSLGIVGSPEVTPPFL